MLASYMAIAGNIFGAAAILFGYYLRKNFPVDMWGYSVINSIAITSLIVISCFIIIYVELSRNKTYYTTLII